MDRVQEINGSDMTAMVMMLYSLPRVEARMFGLAVMPGQGEAWRITHAIQVWQGRTTAAEHLLIAGVNPGEKTLTGLTVGKLVEEPFKLTRRDGVCVMSCAENTRDQAQRIVCRVREENIPSLALFVSPYHLLRAYCTLLRACNEVDVRIPIAPVPVMISPEVIIPEAGVSAWELVQGELDWIATYQQKAHVATYDELRGYLDWLWGQEPYTQGQ